MHHFTTSPSSILPGDTVRHPGTNAPIVVDRILRPDDGTIIVHGRNRGRVVYGPEVRDVGIARPTVSA